MVEPLDIRIQEIPHATQRYATVGDWWETSEGSWQFRVSNMGKWQYAFLVGLHEMVEMALCKARGIAEADVMQFDLDFEARRAPGNEDEPGHDAAAPYHQEHVFAESIERQMCAALGLDWDQYDAAVVGVQ